MAKKKTYYDPQNGQQYYHGETLGAANWSAPESDKDETHLNQYNYIPAYDAYRQYLEEEKRRQEEERRRIMHQQSYANPNEAPVLKSPVNIKAGAAADIGSPEGYLSPSNPMDSADFQKWVEDKQKAQTTAVKSPIPKAEPMDTPTAMSGKDKNLLAGIGNSINNAKQNVTAQADDFNKLTTREKYKMYMDELEQTAIKNGTLPESQRVALSEYTYQNMDKDERKAIDTIMEIEGKEFDDYVDGGVSGVDKNLQNVDYTGRGNYAQNRIKQRNAAVDKEISEREAAKNEAIRILKAKGWDDAKIERELARFKELEDYRKTLEKKDRYTIDPNASAGEKWGKGILNTVEAIPTGLYKGIESLFAEKGAYGRNTSSRYAYTANASQEAVGQVSLNAIGNDHPYLQQVYQAGEAGTESLVPMLLTGAIASGLGIAGAGTALSQAKAAGKAVTGGMKGAAAAEKAIELASLVPFSANAYESGYKDAVNRGFGESQAQAYGISVGVIEAATEIFSLDKAWKLAEGTKVGRNLFAAAAVQAGIEGSEEVASELAGRLADYLCVDVGKTGKTQKELDMEQIRAEHPEYTEQQVANEAAKKFAGDVFWAFAGGAISASLDTPIMMGMGAYNARQGGKLNKAISDRYQSLEVNGNSEYEQMLQADKERYQNNPTQFVADQYKAKDEEGQRIKKGLEEIAEKEREGRKLSASDKAFVAQHANVDQVFIEKLYDINDESNIPYEYRTVKKNISENEAREMLAKAAKAGDVEGFLEAQELTRNSADENVAKNAEEIIHYYALMAQEHGITKEAMGKAVLSMKQAYLEGRKGKEVDKENMSLKAQTAYNEGRKEYLEYKNKTEVSSQNALKSTVVGTSDGGTIRLAGSFDSDGKIRTATGESIDVDKLDLTSESAAVKAYRFADEYEDVNTKNEFLRGIKDNTDIADYNRDFKKAHNLGMAGVSEEAMKQGYSTLDDETKTLAFEAGQREARARATQQINKAWGVVPKAEGIVYNEAGIRDKKALNMLNQLASTLHVDFVVTGSQSVKGERGSFNPKTNTITVNADHVMAVFHEIGEFAEFYNKEGYDELKKAVADLSAKKFGTDKYHNMLKAYQNAYGNANQDSSADEMSGEMFNDVISAMLSTDKGANALAQYLAQNYDAEKAKSLGQKIVDIVKGLADTIKRLVDPEKNQTSGEYQKAVYKIADELSAHADEFISVLDKAVRTYKGVATEEAVNAVTEPVGIQYDAENEIAFPTAFSLETWNESDYVTNREEAAKALRDALGVSVKKAKEYIDQINSVAAMIIQDPKGLDYIALDGVDKKGKKIGMLMDNSEYGKTIDGSTLCKKRLGYTDTLSAIQRALPNTALTPEEMVDIVKMMQDKGYETPCGLCYVESTRKFLPKYAKQWIEEYKKTHRGEYVPNMAEINTPEGIAEIRAKHPEVYADFEKFMNAKGQAKPKLFQTRAAYQPGEILDFFKIGKKVNTKKVNDWNINGGFRLQSYSDLEVVQIIDMMQAIMDMSRLGLWSQAYTKVPAFADIFGGTGVKINCSTIAKGVDKKGNLIFDDVEGMPHKEAMRLRNKYSDNVGIVTVVFDDAQLRAALNNDQIDFVLPFHMSSWSTEQAKTITGQENIKDYTHWQNERYIDKSRGKLSNIMPNTYWDFSKTGRQNAEKYLQLCKEDGRIPKFDFLLEEKNGKYTLPKGSIGDNYFKLLIDFKMYNNEGMGKSQTAVQPIFDMDVATKTLKDYSGDHTKDHQHKDIVDAFVKQYKKDHKGVKYSLDVDSEGNQLTEGQEEYFEDSKIRDEQGRLKVMYHGTQNDFTIFDPKKLGGKNGTAEGYGIYFTENPEISQAYGGKQLKGYLNVTNPARYNEKTIKAKDLVKLIKATAEAEAQNLLDEGYDSVDDAIKDTWISNIENTYDMPIDQVYRSVAQKILDMNHNDMDIIQEIMADQAIRSYGDAYKFYDILKDTMGIDGFITEWEDSKTGEKNEVVVAIDSNQFKNIDNENPTENSDIRFSLDIDSDGNRLTKDQQRYFKDSKVVDDEGNLLVLYHGINNNSPSFNTFDSNKTDDGLSFFLTDNEDVARSYGLEKHTVYADVKNPLIIDAEGKEWFNVRPKNVKGFPEMEEITDASYKRRKVDGEYLYDFTYTLNGKTYTDTGMSQAEAEEKYGNLFGKLNKASKHYDSLPVEKGTLNWVSLTTRDWSRFAKDNGYDGVIIKNVLDENASVQSEDSIGTDVIVFRSNQIKLTSNVHPTENEDIRYSIDVDSEGRELTEGQQKYFNNSKVVDDEGRLIVMYHGTEKAGFTVFDPANSDDGTSLFFTSDEEVAESYSGTSTRFSPSKPMTFNELRETIESITLGDIYVEEDGDDVRVMKEGMIQDPEDIELFKGSLLEAQKYAFDHIDEYTHGYEANYGVYLNLKNPYIVDAKGAQWNDLDVAGDAYMHYSGVAIYRSSYAGYESYQVDYSKGRNSYHENYDSLEDLEKKFGEIYEPFEFDEVYIEDLYLDKEGNRIPTTTRSVAAFAKAKGYDGVIFKDINDVGIYGEASDDAPSTVAIAFSPEQVKDINNLNPTSSEDIRYELDIDDEGGWVDFDSVFGETRTEEKAVDILAKGMEALKNKEVDVPRLRTLALKLRNEFGSLYNTKTFTENLQKAFAYMQTEDHVDYKTMMGILRDIARPVVEASGEKVGEQEYKDFINHFKGTRIKLTEKQKEEVRYSFGSLKAFRNAMMPLNISDKGDTTLDQMWDEFCEQTGYALDRDTVEGDQPAALLDTLQAMRPTVRNDFGGDIEDLSKDLAMRIVEEYFEGEAAKQMKAEVKEYRDRLKKAYNERMKEARGKANAELRARNKRRAEEAKEREDVRNLKHDIKSQASKLFTWVVKPTEGKSVPHNMMVPVMQFLQAIDFVDPVITMREDGKWTTKVFDRVDYEDGHKKFIYKDLVGDSREDVLKQFNEAIGRGEGTREQRTWTDKMQGMREIYDRVLKDSDFEDTDMDFLMQTLDAQGLAEDFDKLLADHKGELSMNQLNSRELGLIDNIIKNIFHALNKGNKAFSANVDIVNLAQSTMQDAEGKEIKDRNSILKGIYKMLRLDNVTPRTFFKLLGSRGHEVYKFLRGGLNQEILDLKKASEFMEGAMKGIDASTWTGQKATVHEFALSNGSVKMTDDQIMGLYMTIRRNGGMDRIKGGIRVDDIVTNKERVKRQNPIHLTEADIRKIESVLTPEQIELAKKMQKYMASDCSEQGNNTSLKLYGFKKFTDPTYYPWTVDKETVPTNNSSENIPMFTGIERSGFTKQLKEGASNPLVIRGIFDVFADHVAEMAAYHGYAASVKDTLRWMNYREKTSADGFDTWATTKNAINRLSGDEGGVKYISTLLLDINKANKSQYIGNITDKLMGHYKAAAVGANLRVIAQQPTAYFRALNQIDAKYLLKVNPKKAIQNIKKSQEECPISWWKSKGYYETNLGQPIKEIVTGIATWQEKLKDKLMSPAGYADDLTWGFLYTAVENEQRDLLRGKNVTPEEFRKAVNDRFDEVVDNTQVVDSTLHRSQYMRAKDTLNKIQTAFMAEPTKSYNMLLEAGIEDMREKTGKRTARAVTAFILSTLATSAAAAVVDAMRKNKDDEDWWETWLENLKENVVDNMNPFNLLPVVKDLSAGLYNLLTGASTYGQSGNRFDIEAISTVMNAAQAANKLRNGESNKTAYGNFMTILAKPFSQITGIPAYNLARDSVALYNTFFDNIEMNLNSNSKNEKKKELISDINKESSDNALDETITDAIENGVSIYDLKGAVQSEFKNKYFDAYSEGDEEEAKKIADKAARAYARMGLTDEEIDDIINGWQEEVITYSALDKAIASGEGIAEEIKHVQEGKDDDKIVKHIMDRYTETVAYEDMNNTESEWRKNVETALQAVDPTLDYDSAHEEALEKKKASEEKAAVEAKNKEMKSDFFDAVDKKDGSAGRKALETMKSEGVEAKSVKSSTSTEYHNRWKEAKTQAEKDKAKSDWMSAYKLINTVYGSKSNDLEKTWRDWEADQK